MLDYTEWSLCIFVVIIPRLLFIKHCCLSDLLPAYLPHTCQSTLQTAFLLPLIKGTHKKDSSRHRIQPSGFSDHVQVWWSLSHVQRLWSHQVSTNLSVYCWPKVCHSLKPILFSAAFGVWSSWRSDFLCPGNVSSVLFTNQFIFMSPHATSCWKISFVAEEEINRDIKNIFINGWGRFKAEFFPFYLKLKKQGEFCVHSSAWILRRLGQEGCLQEMRFNGGGGVCAF